jgi:hypothetical protein
LLGRLEAVVESELTADEVQLDGWIAGKGEGIKGVIGGATEGARGGT